MAAHLLRSGDGALPVLWRTWLFDYGHLEPTFYWDRNSALYRTWRCALWRDAPPKAERVFVLMDGEAFHFRGEGLLNDGDYVLRHSVRFLAMDESAPRQEVFGCEAGEFARTIELLKLALLLELGAGGTLEGWREATWRPW